MGHNTFSYIHYEDDGIGFGFKDGDYLLREVEVDPAKQTIHFSASDGNFQSKFQKVKLYFHGSAVEKIQLNDHVFPVGIETFAFLDRLTEFDPLPDHSHPYFDMKNVPTVVINYVSEDFTVNYY
jgi:alpha-glucosidase